MTTYRINGPLNDRTFGQITHMLRASGFTFDSITKTWTGEQVRPMFTRRLADMTGSKNQAGEPCLETV